MCGIVGVSNNNSFYLLPAINNLLTHRGPDDSGEYIDRDQGISLAVRRLAIIDLESGQQPMSNEDESLWIVCNGEIYNSPELRIRLLAQGHRFKTKNSDVEVLLHLYEDKGTNLLSELNGMFAFVLYDKRKGILFGARDRIGIKPFYYAYKNEHFAFSSELKSLLLLPWVSREINFTSLSHYLSLQFIPAPDSIFNDIKKLPGGHFFTFDIAKKHLHVQKYWDLDVTQIDEKTTVGEWIEILREKLKEAAKRWTLSDVPIACSLSGGLDSSYLVALLAESGVGDLRTYSLGFRGENEQECNELPLAKMVSEKWGTHHHEVILDSKKVLEDLEHLVWHLDEPYGGGLPSWYIYELIGKDVKVCLTGTGGDELFSNYGKYWIFERSKWYRHLKTVRDAIRYRVFREIIDGLHYPIGHFYHRYYSDAVKNEIIFDDNHKPNASTEAYLEEVWNKSDSDNPRNAVAYVDFHLQLPEEFLLVTDRFSMAHSVEARVPFLDHELVQLVFQMPPMMRTGWSQPKSFFKKVIKDLLPEELVQAPKRGFILPLHIWTRKELKPLIERMLSPEFLRKQGIFSEGIFNKIVRPHLTFKRDYTQQVWTLFMFQLWYKQYCESS